MSNIGQMQYGVIGMVACCFAFVIICAVRLIQISGRTKDRNPARYLTGIGKKSEVDAKYAKFTQSQTNPEG